MRFWRADISRAASGHRGPHNHPSPAAGGTHSRCQLPRPASEEVHIGDKRESRERFIDVETWKPVVGFEGLYEVSDFGRVRGVDRLTAAGHQWKGRVLKLTRSRQGYLYVGLHKDGKHSSHRVHRMVLEAFVGPCPAGMEACHGPDHDRSNNRLSNLRWDTRIANHADMTARGTRRDTRGERSSFAKMNSTDVERVRDLLRCGCTNQRVADWLDISQPTVSNIRTGKTWRHL